MGRVAAVGNLFRSKSGAPLAIGDGAGKLSGVPHFRVDLHNHCQGDPVDTLQHTLIEHIDAARRAGLDAIAMTWHRRVCEDEEARAYARAQGLLLMSGMESEIKGRHLVVLGLREGDLPGQTTWDEVRALRARQPGVLVFAPHPFYPHPACLNQEMNGNEDCIDAVEWCALHTRWLPSRVNPNLRAARWAHRHGKPILACSDAHSLPAVGRNPSTVEADELTEAAILDAVRAGRITFPRHSLGFGALVKGTTAAVAAQPRHLGRWMAGQLRRRGAGFR